MLAERYEQLRSAVVHGTGQGFAHAWAVLARSGMAAWAAAVGAVPTVRRVTGGTRPSPSGPEPPAAVTAQLVAVLAQMVLARAAPRPGQHAATETQTTTSRRDR